VNVLEERSFIPGIEGPMKVEVSIDPSSRRLVDLEIKPMESSRFFEVILLNREAKAVPYIASRICGICGYAHALCSAMAIEDAWRLEVPDSVRSLRELIAILSTVNSHLFHLVTLLFTWLGRSRPISLNFKRNLIELMKVKTHTIDKALNELCGDKLHPRNIVPGGFTYLPSMNRVMSTLEGVNRLNKLVYGLVEELLSFDLLREEDFKTHYVALKNETRYGLLEGCISIDSMIEIKVSNFKKYFIEQSISGSPAKLCLLYGKESYMVGALARLNVNSCQECEYRRWLHKLPSTNPYLIPIAQGVEVMKFLDIIQDLRRELRDEPRLVKPHHYPRRARGMSAIEAPRGLLYYEVEVISHKLTALDIITPTVQNLANMKDSLKYIVQRLLEGMKRAQIDEIRREAERLVQCYDPCIPCAVHVHET